MACPHWWLHTWRTIISFLLLHQKNREFPLNNDTDVECYCWITERVVWIKLKTITCIFFSLNVYRGNVYRSQPGYRSRWYAVCFRPCCHTSSTTRRSPDSGLCQRLWRWWNQVWVLIFLKQLIKVCKVLSLSTLTPYLVFDSLAVVVEDSSSSCCVTVKVFPHMTTAALKQQVRL